MLIGQPTPLLDFFRRGEVDREVRLLAARGAVAPRAGEQLAILVLLVGDPDAEVSARARTTIEAIPKDALAGFLARRDTPEELRQFFADRGVGPSTTPAADASQPLVEAETEESSGAETAASEREKPIALLSVMERLKLAVRGSREHRAMLIRDPNKLVSIAVLSSPKLTESEVESFARMGNVAVDVLRVIGSNRSWLKNYGVMSGLARNPRTPPTIALRLLSQLNVKDIRAISTDRNVPDAVRIAARKYVQANESRRQ
jgi:hypothetical protein